MWGDHVLFIPLSADRLGAIMNNAATNIHIKIFVWSDVLSAFRYIPRRGSGGTHGNSMFNF